MSQGCFIQSALLPTRFLNQMNLDMIYFLFYKADSKHNIDFKHLRNYIANY